MTVCRIGLGFPIRPGAHKESSRYIMMFSSTIFSSHHLTIQASARTQHTLARTQLAYRSKHGCPGYRLLRVQGQLEASLNGRPTVHLSRRREWPSSTPTGPSSGCISRSNLLMQSATCWDKKTSDIDNVNTRAGYAIETICVLLPPSVLFLYILARVTQHA